MEQQEWVLIKIKIQLNYYFQLQKIKLLHFSFLLINPIQNQYLEDLILQKQRKINNLVIIIYSNKKIKDGQQVYKIFNSDNILQQIQLNKLLLLLWIVELLLLYLVNKSFNNLLMLSNKNQNLFNIQFNKIIFLYNVILNCLILYFQQKMLIIIWFNIQFLKSSIQSQAIKFAQLDLVVILLKTLMLFWEMFL
ncbi:hypothetical protein IMG5_008740 [Ichthyophthirius multifiliis]|uniref:Transmembrane protein n=1 Tax=Ichthyophthirius multifiliis TaxID=5932 RepID=G0QJT2_ICHMU|nr:hypothetical protein IMG5_008740 [Ichthyophthirius multifiliis]EGR34525.1 hypothetical protein IMG5_008740 [Ichthyophthirius multifiliis]|eukprot:XP_004039829.1 hypothetical protein IMG5_008740 [Ichthyophthirius multifiliis]